jgi:hypothetical protein
MKHNEYVAANLTQEEINDSMPATEQNYENIVKLFNSKLTAKKAESPKQKSKSTVITLTESDMKTQFYVTKTSSTRLFAPMLATAAAFMLIVGAVFMFDSGNAIPPLAPNSPDSTTAPPETTAVEESTETTAPPNTTKSKMLCPRTGKIIELLEVYADFHPGLYIELRDIAEPFTLQMGELEMKGYILALTEGAISEISSQNGQVMWFTNGVNSVDERLTELKGWSLKKGDKLTLSFNIDLSDDRSMEDGEIAEIGYFDGENFVDLYVGKIKDTFSVDFIAPQDGDYFFYHINASTAPQNYKEISIS